MKKLFVSLALVLGMASCQNDFNDINATVGGEREVMINVALPMDTRAGSADSAIKNGVIDSDEYTLRYILEIFDESGINSKTQQKVCTDDLQTTFAVRLVPDRKYHFVVWADIVETPAAGTEAVDLHYVTAELDKITLQGEWDPMDETRDAYTGKWFDTYNGASDINIPLTRPFAKLRIVTTDMLELFGGVTPTHANISFTGETKFYNTFNALTQQAEAKENANPEFSYEIKSYGETGANKTLYADYFFANDDVVKFVFAAYEDAARTKLIKNTVFTTDIPVKRNNLTTVIGNILTEGNDIEVKVDDKFGGNHNYDADADALVSNVYVANLAELEYAFDNARKGVTNIFFTEDIVGNSTVHQRVGKNIVIDGQGKKYDGTITVDGRTDRESSETLVIKNVNFETEGTNEAFILQYDQTGNLRYPHNITIDGCTFKSTNTVAVKFRSPKNIVIKNCTVNGGHSLGQFTGGVGVMEIDNVNVTAGRGVSFGTTANCVVKNSTFNVESYGLRPDGSGAYSLRVENVNITAAQPVIVRNLTGNYTANFDGTNTLTTTTTDDYQVIFTKGGDSAPYVLPTVKYEANGILDFKVFPEHKVVADASGLQDAFADPDIKNVILTDDVDYGTVTIGELKDVTIKGGENSKMIFKTDANTKIENVTIEAVNFVDTTTAKDFVIIDANAQIDNLVIEGCTFEGVDKKSGHAVNGCNANATITFKNCTFKNLGYGIYGWNGYKALSVVGCTFDHIWSWSIMPQSVCYDLTVTGCTFMNCNTTGQGGLVKAGTLTAGHTFTFTNNTITDCTVSGDHNWFSLNTTNGTAVVNNNIKDGVAWTPTAADGLKM